MANDLFCAMALALTVASLASCSRQAEPPAAGESIVIDNVQPRYDTAGQIVDAHGGCLQFFEGRFYLYGTSYGDRKDSLDTNNYFSVYSSPDLSHWTNEGRLIPDQPTGVYTRPSVVFNPNTRKYVLWYNWFPKLWDGQAGVAVSDKPNGPFTVVNPKANLVSTHPGDGSLFADDDGNAYYTYTSMNEEYAIRVERLTTNYLDSTGEASKVMARGCEAPVLFQRNRLYYILTGPLCPDCVGGSEVQVFISFSPLGPFVTKPDANINPSANGQIRYMPVGDAIRRTETNAVAATVPAQQTWVAKIPLGTEAAYIWMGDRWQSTPDGTKGHDGQFWSTPMEFGPDGSIAPLKNVPRWYLMK